jgi:hypothetical protein
MNFPGGVISIGFILLGALVTYFICRRTSRVAIVYRIPLPTQLAKSLGSTLYSDLRGKGGLAPALQAVITELDAHLTIEDPADPRNIFYASVKSGERSSRVSLQSGGFSTDFLAARSSIRRGWARELVDVGRAIVAFQVEKASVNKIAARFNWFVPGERAYSHEQGAHAFVDIQWRWLEGWLRSDEYPLSKNFLTLFLEAARRTELRQLFPIPPCISSVSAVQQDIHLVTTARSHTVWKLVFSL